MRSALPLAVTARNDVQSNAQSRAVSDARYLRRSYQAWPGCARPLNSAIKSSTAADDCECLHISGQGTSAFQGMSETTWFPTAPGIGASSAQEAPWSLYEAAIQGFSIAECIIF